MLDGRITRVSETLTAAIRAGRSGECRCCGEIMVDAYILVDSNNKLYCSWACLHDLNETEADFGDDEDSMDGFLDEGDDYDDDDWFDADDDGDENDYILQFPSTNTVH